MYKLIKESNLYDVYHSEEKERSEKGIPYHPEVVEWFRSITSELNVDFNF